MPRLFWLFCPEDAETKASSSALYMLEASSAARSAAFRPLRAASTSAWPRDAKQTGTTAPVLNGSWRLCVFYTFHERIVVGSLLQKNAHWSAASASKVTVLRLLFCSRSPLAGLKASNLRPAKPSRWAFFAAVSYCNTSEWAA